MLFTLCLRVFVVIEGGKTTKAQRHEEKKFIYLCLRVFVVIRENHKGTKTRRKKFIYLCLRVFAVEEGKTAKAQLEGAVRELTNS